MILLFSNDRLLPCQRNKILFIRVSWDSTRACVLEKSGLWPSTIDTMHRRLTYVAQIRVTGRHLLMQVVWVESRGLSLIYFNNKITYDCWMRLHRSFKNFLQYFLFIRVVQRYVSRKLFNTLSENECEIIAFHYF